MARALLVLALMMGAASASAQSSEAPALQSPEIGQNGEVTFRLWAPEADHVRMARGSSIPGLSDLGVDLSKGENDVWSITYDSLEPGPFRYRFDVDGVPVLDPSNPLTSESMLTPWSFYHLPGQAYMDTQNVPHGAVAKVTYWSDMLGMPRRMHVYTPPGYELGNGHYPVLYLFHGGGGSDDNWSAAGRVNFIVDNLIASGDAKPMIIVMPDGHLPGRPVGGRDYGMRLIAESAVEFATDIKPHIEESYRILRGPENTAIAGLSMGGGHTLEVAFSDLAEYGYIGVFSSGVFGIEGSDEWALAHSTALEDPALREGLEYFWFAIGDEDFLLDMSKASVDLFRQHGFDVDYHESGGGHTWDNWRDYIYAFAQKLFREGQ